MMTQHDPHIIPTGLRRAHAARYCGVSPGTFDAMVRDGLMPAPRLARPGLKLWLRQELDDALFSLPSPGGEEGENSCDALFG